MMYQADKFTNDPDEFRRVFGGETAELVNGDLSPVENLTNEEISGFRVAAVTDGDGGWITADRVAEVQS